MFYLKERDIISTPSATWRAIAMRSVTVSRSTSLLRSRSRLVEGREDVFYLKERDVVNTPSATWRVGCGLTQHFAFTYTFS